MIKALFTAATGLSAQQTVVDNTANNLANANTTGFKRSNVDFEDLIYETKRSAGSDAAQGLQLPTGLQIGSGVRIAGTSKNFSQGVLTNTGNPLDLAIQGNGFFKVTLPNGQIAYTRSGNFTTNSTGEIVTADGYPIAPQISLPQDTTSVSIGADGTISVITAGAPNKSTAVGSLVITQFLNPAGLSSEGSNMYSETAASGAPKDSTPGTNGTGTLQQNYLEGSNVQVVQELVNLILAQRAYEFNTRAVKAADEMLSDATNITR
jgi:flagellar basal-body rod protein FlgG